MDQQAAQGGQYSIGANKESIDIHGNPFGVTNSSMHDCAHDWGEGGRHGHAGQQRPLEQWLRWLGRPWGWVLRASQAALPAALKLFA